MGLRRIEPPTDEPVSLDEAKAHARVDGSHSDAELTRLVAAARAYVERATGRSLLEQTWELTLDRFPCEDDPHGAVIRLPMGDVIAVDSIAYVDEDGESQVVEAATYVVSVGDNPARVARLDGASWPSTRIQPDAVTVTYSAGYGDEAEQVPGDLREAVLLVFGHWLRNKEGVVTGTIATALQHSVDALIDSYRLHA